MHHINLAYILCAVRMFTYHSGQQHSVTKPLLSLGHMLGKHYVAAEVNCLQSSTFKK